MTHPLGVVKVEVAAAAAAAEAAAALKWLFVLVGLELLQGGASLYLLQKSSFISFLFFAARA